jgi:hypothetical protein
MKQFEDYIYLPSVKINDVLNTGNNIDGKMIMTARYLFILPDKAQDMVGIVSKNIYAPSYFNSVVDKLDSVEIVAFETELISTLPPRYVIPYQNLEKFEVNIGFMFFGGIRYKCKGEKIQSGFVGNVKNRKMIKAFWDRVKPL